MTVSAHWPYCTFILYSAVMAAYRSPITTNRDTTVWSECQKTSQII